MTNMRRMSNSKQYDLCDTCGRMVHLSFMVYYPDKKKECDNCRRINTKKTIVEENINNVER